MERQRGQVECLLWNHLSKQALWKKCLQDNSLTSSFPWNPQRHTQHSTIPQLLPPMDLYCVIEIFLLEFEIESSSSSISESSASILRFTEYEEEEEEVVIAWRMDLKKFFKSVMEITVFITNTGSTPSAGPGKFDSPIVNYYYYRQFEWNPNNSIQT